MSDTQTTLQRIMAQDEACYMPVFGRRTPLCIERGEGAYVYDTEGNRYLDLVAGIAVNVLGHAHPALVAAVSAQAARVIHASNLYYNRPQTQLAVRLSALSGGMKVFLSNSGAEANEAAIKLCRKRFAAAGKPRSRIVSMKDSFHGRTLATVTATGQPKYHDPFRPLPPGFVHVPFNDPDALLQAVDDTTAAVLLEPIQGESGVHPATPEFLRAVEARCRATGALLVLDEVQTGMGRTGTFFAYEALGLSPDIVTLAKGLGGGVPIGATLARPDVADSFQVGDHGSTFGGNPLAAAAALAVLDTLQAEDLVRRAGILGEKLMAGLRGIAARTGRIAEVRGRGLMIGLTLAEPGAADLKARLMAAGFLVNSIGASILRLLPPLVLSADQAEAFCNGLEGLLAPRKGTGDARA